MPKISEKQVLATIHHLAFGRQLYFMRTKANINMRGFAKTVGSSPAWISYIERGRRIPCWSLVENILRFFSDRKASHHDLRQLESLARKLLLEKTFHADSSGSGQVSFSKN